MELKVVFANILSGKIEITSIINQDFMYPQAMIFLELINVSSLL